MGPETLSRGAAAFQPQHSPQPEYRMALDWMVHRAELFCSRFFNPSQPGTMSDEGDISKTQYPSRNRTRGDSHPPTPGLIRRFSSYMSGTIDGEEPVPVMPFNKTITTARLHIRPLTMEDASEIFTIRSDPEIMKWATSPPETAFVQTKSWIRNKILNNPSEVANYSIELLGEPSTHTNSSAGAKRNRVIGIVGAVRGPEIGYLIARQYHNKGYGTEALRAYLDLFWDAVPMSPLPELQAERAGDGLPSGSASEPSPVSTGTAPDPRAVMSADDADSNMPPYAEPSPIAFARGWDYVEAVIDPENKASAHVLKKCGFTLWSTTKDDYESPNLGIRSTAIYRLARPETQLGAPPGPFEVDMGEGLR